PVPGRMCHSIAPVLCAGPGGRAATVERRRSSRSGDAARATGTPGAGRPVAYAMAGSATFATSEPNEMYFVSHTAPAKISNAGGTAAGVRIEKTPHAVATPLPPRHRSQIG